MSKLPLARFKVIDFTHALAGATAVRQLSDWGADVVRIESPRVGGTRGIGSFSAGKGEHDDSGFQNRNRNKRSITIDLKKPEGLQVLYRLVKDVDVVIENFRPRVKHQLKIDYETLKKINPRIVYGSLSGYGQEGPYSERPGVDQIVQGLGGLMSITGYPGQGPARAGVPVCDLSAGMFLGIGILVALLEREVSGEGQWVQTSLLEAMVTMLEYQATTWLNEKQVPTQTGGDHAYAFPSGLFDTSDGYISIGSVGDTMFVRLCNALGLEELTKNPDYDTEALRKKNKLPLRAALEAVTRTKTSAEWVEVINKARVPCGPVYSIDQVFADPQVQLLGMVKSIEHKRLGRLEMVRHAATLSRTNARIRGPAPDAGEHTDEVLREAGFADAEISQLRAKQVI